MYAQAKALSARLRENREDEKVEKLQLIQTLNNQKLQ